MTVVTHDETGNTNTLRKFYVQPHGPLGCLEVNIDNEGRISLWAMPRWGHTGSGNESLKARLQAFGAEFNTNCVNNYIDTLPIRMFLEEQGKLWQLPHGCTFSPVTECSLEDLQKWNLIDDGVVETILADVSGAVNNKLEPRDIRTTPRAKVVPVAEPVETTVAPSGKIVIQN